MVDGMGIESVSDVKSFSNVTLLLHTVEFAFHTKDF